MKKHILIACYFFAALILFSECKKDSSSTQTTATITALNCSSATFSATATVNKAYTGTATVPYTGGNAATYSAGSAISSTGVTGLTATLTAGTLASGAGSLTFSISGTPTSSGTASFALSFGGQTCTMGLTVSSGATATSCASLTGVAKLVCLCDSFESMLSSSQISALQLSYNYTNIKTWSNLPAALSPRIGLQFSTLSSAQLGAAKAIVKAMTGTYANEGYDEVNQVWLADDYLLANGGGSDYGSGNYYIAFFGTPSVTGQFEIMETGHHKTVANTYKNGSLIAYTPHFEASEPISFTSGSNTYAPITQERDAFVAFLASLNSSQLASAKSSSSFSDLVLVPGQDWKFPTTHSGLVGSSLSASQKTLLTNTIKTYTEDIDDVNGATVLSSYVSKLDSTYVLYSGTTSMTTKYDYFRIDGPNVWIEFIVAGGIVFPTQTHIHSIWRDRVNDYAGTKN